MAVWELPDPVRKLLHNLLRALPDATRGPSTLQDATKPYEFIGFGAMDATKPSEFIGFGAIAICCSSQRAHGFNPIVHMQLPFQSAQHISAGGATHEARY